MNAQISRYLVDFKSLQFLSILKFRLVSENLVFKLVLKSIAHDPICLRELLCYPVSQGIPGSSCISFPRLGISFPKNPNFFQREWYVKTTSEPQRYSFFSELVIFSEQSQEMHILDMNICFQNTIPHQLILVLPIQNWVQKIFTGFREQCFLSSSMLIIIFDALST